MEHMGRPLDVQARGDGSILILEDALHRFKTAMGMLSGRVLARRQH